MVILILYEKHILLYGNTEYSNQKKESKKREAGSRCSSERSKVSVVGIKLNSNRMEYMNGMIELSTVRGEANYHYTNSRTRLMANRPTIPWLNQIRLPTSLPFPRRS